MRNRDGRRSGGRGGHGRDNRGGRRGGGGRHRSGNYRGGRSGGGYRGRRGGRDPRAAAQSGNQRERIAIESGALVLIDQFMLANPQFIKGVADLMDSEPQQKDVLIEKFGGTVVELAPGTYRIERDPYAYTIVIHPDGDDCDMQELTANANQNSGHVFVDTRCLAMIDRELLDDTALLEKYQQLWFSGQEKACRDLLRDNGGAVRYGFQRYGDELGVYQIAEENVVCLWPDVNEAEVTEELAAEA